MLQWISTLLLVAVSGCSPAISYHFKEKVIERVGTPRRAEYVDRFQMGLASGNVDVLFVIDNSVWMDGGLAPLPKTGISKFQETYSRLLQAMAADPRMRQVDYRVQLTTASLFRMPDHPVRKGEEFQSHLKELFAMGFASLLSSDRLWEKGVINPFAATLSGLGGKVFAGRAFTPLFVVYVLGGDDGIYPSIQDSPSVRETFSLAFKRVRHFETSRSWILTKQKHGRFEHCADFNPTPRFQSSMAFVPWRSVGKSDLCDVEWDHWNNALVQSIIDTKSRIVLTHPPFEPSTMTVYAAGQLLRYGDQYRFDATQNEIIFESTASVRPEDLIAVNYFLEPVASDVSGDGTPPGNTVPGTTP